jgi:hypothetical protein
LPPPAIGPERQPLHDEAIHRLEHQHFGQDELTFRGGLELGGRLVPQPKELVPADRVLVPLDPLQDVLLIMLLIGVGRTAAPV